LSGIVGVDALSNFNDGIVREFSTNSSNLIFFKLNFLISIGFISLFLGSSLLDTVRVDSISSIGDNNECDEEDASHYTLGDVDFVVLNANVHPDVCPDGEDCGDTEYPNIINFLNFTIFTTDSYDGDTRDDKQVESS
jgi:hypothetical protein